MDSVPETLLTANLWLYIRSLALALVIAAAVAALGWFGDELNVGPGLVPIWDEDGRGYWLAGVALVLAVGTMFQWVDRELPRNPSGDAESRAGSTGPQLRWVLPSMTALSVVLFLGVYRGTTAIAAGALIAFGALLAGTIARHLMMDRDDQARERARLVFTLVVHGIAFLALAMIYINKVRSLFSATAVLLVGVLLLLALTEGEDELFNRRLVYALVGGIMLGQVTWGLNYWQAAGWTGGAVLLIFFYLYGGLILTHLRRSVDFRDVAEYGTVACIAFGIVVYSLFA